MIVRLSMGTALAAMTSLSAALSAAWGDCPLDHYFVLQENGQLAVDKRLIYRHGDPAEGYYPLTWSPVYGCWSGDQPGFEDTTDPAHGFPPDVQLEGTPNVDYQIWLELLDLAPDLYLQTDDGTWLTQIGDRYNLSDWPEHHVHIEYRAYVPQSPPPDQPFHVAYRLVDELGPYGSSVPFSVVFNLPAPAVEATTPEYRGLLAGVAGTQVTFTFHRAITVTGGPPVTITDEDTHTQDYYSGYFDYAVSPDGMTLILDQTGPALPEDTSLEVTLTQHVQDAVVVGQPALPFTLFVATPILGDLDLDGDVDLSDLAALLANYGTPSGAAYGDGDLDGDGDVDLSDLAALLANYGAGG